VLRFVSDDFQENKEPTIGAAFLTQKCDLEDRTVKFEIWDTAGQERFASLAPMYYRNAQAALVVYDLTKAATLQKAKHWVSELRRQANPNIVIALVGNKLDLCIDGAEEDRRMVSKEEAQSYAEEDGNDLLFLETSAKSGVNVRAVFEAIAEKIPPAELTRKPAGVSGAAGRVDLNAPIPGEASRSNAGCAC